MRWFGFLLLLGSVSCGDPLHPTQLIEKSRTIGAQVSVDLQPERATPARGETAIARFWVADPGAPVPRSYALAVCRRDLTTAGVPACADGAIAQATGSGSPQITFSVPAGLPEGERLLVLGVLCADSAPNTDNVLAAWPDTIGCQGNRAQTSRVHFDVFVSPERDNKNPNLLDAPINFDGQAWEAETPADLNGPCASSARTVAANGATYTVEVMISDEDRESVNGHRELSELSSFSTRGRFERAFTFIEADSPDTDFRIEWKAPTTAPAGGRYANFFFVLRDGRGGADFSTRTLCVVP